MATIEITACDFPKCEVREDTAKYRVGGQMGQPRTLDLCEAHAAPIVALMDKAIATGTPVKRTRARRDRQMAVVPETAK